MKKLLPSVLLVVLTWFTAASIVALFMGDGFEVVFLGYETWFVTSLLGIAVGIVLYTIRHFSDNYIGQKARLSEYGYQDSAVSVSILDFYEANDSAKKKKFMVPIPPVMPPKAADVDVIPFAARVWYASLKAQYPAYAEVIDEAYCIMETKPGIPASPAGGHGGLSLVDHSLNVVDSIMELAPVWSYDGVRSKGGNVIRDVIDPEGKPHKFDASDPILPVAGFIHDIGKVLCYDKAGSSWEEVRGGHGEVGSEMVRKMTSVRHLPIVDRDALILAVSFYHHETDMPIADWVGDRAYSLTGLLYLADCDASAREGDKGEKATSIESYRRVKKLRVRDVTAEEAEKDEQEIAEVELDEAASDDMQAMASATPERDDDSGAASQEAIKAAASWIAPDGSSAREVFDSLLSMPDSINGASANRFALKHGEWCYVFDARLRKRAASFSHDDTVEQIKNGQMNPFTRALLADLEAKGLLMQEFGGRRYSFKRALFRSRSKSKAGAKQDAHDAVMFVVRSSVSNIVANAANCPYPPEIIGPLWGEASAINKKGEAKSAEQDAKAGGPTAAPADAPPAAPAAPAPAASAPSPAPAPAREAASPSPESSDDDPDAPFATQAISASSSPSAAAPAKQAETTEEDGVWSPVQNEPEPPHEEMLRIKTPEGGFLFEDQPVIPALARKLPALDFGTLEAIAISGENLFGLVKRQAGDGKTFYLFEADKLREKYAFTIEDLPRGIGQHTNKAGLLYLFVTMGPNGR